MKVAISTSNTSPMPVPIVWPSCAMDRSRSQIACTIGSPIQSTPNSVAAIAQETFARRGRASARKNVSGKAATSTIITWRCSP